MVVLKLGAHMFTRFVVHYQSWPLRWVGFAEGCDAGKDEFLDKLSVLPCCCLDVCFTQRAISKVVPGDAGVGTQRYRDALRELKDPAFCALLMSWQKDYDCAHTMHNELDHALMRSTCKNMRRGPKIPRATDVISRHYVRKLDNAHVSWLMSKGVQPKAPRAVPKSSSSIVSRALRLLRDAVKQGGKKRRRDATKLTVAKGIKTSFLNARRKARAMRKSIPILCCPYTN